VVGLLLLGAGCQQNPSVPIKPVGNTQTFQYSTESYLTVSTDPGKKDIQYTFQWSDNASDTSMTDFAKTGETTASSHAWTANGTYKVKARATNTDGKSSADWSSALDVTVGANARPNAPDAISGPDGGTPKDDIIIYTKATDGDGDSVYIKFFSDIENNPSKSNGWIGPVASGEYAYDTIRYTTKGAYKVVAFARDIKGGVSDSSPVKGITVGNVGIGWYVYSDNAGSFAFSPALAIGTGELTVYGSSDIESVYSFTDKAGRSRPTVNRGALEEDYATCVDGPTLSADGQRLYIPADNGKLFCMSASGLNTQYTFAPDTFKTEPTTPAVNGNVLYLGRGDSLYRITDNGAGFGVDWAHATTGEVGFAPVISADGQKVFFGADTTGFFCIDPSSNLVWPAPFKAAGAVTCVPAIDGNGVIWAGFEDGRLYGLNPADGSVFWSSDTGGSITGSPVIGADGTVYACREDGWVFAHGAQNWSYQIAGATINAAPCLAPDNTIVVHAELTDDIMIALSQTTGTPQWQISLPTPLKKGRKIDAVGSSPTLGNLNRLYVGSNNDAYFYAVSVDTSAYATGLPSTPWPKYQHDLRNSGFKGGFWSY
jgi:hypothetical protein